MNILKELFLTFSNQKSLLASKKIERFIVFTSFLIITIIYLSFHLRTITATDFIQVIGLWLVYGGYNTFQLYKDKKIDGTNTE